MDDNHEPIDTSELLENLAGRFGMAIRAKVLGADHPSTALSLNNLGALLHSMGDYEGARPYYDRALVILTARLGPNHPHTRTVRNNLARLLEQIDQALS